MSSKIFVLGACCSVALAACVGTADPGTPQVRPTATITLSADDNGNLESCDANGVCETHPNPEGCATLVVNIDEQNGGTCERCEDASGAIIYETCTDTSVACTVVTLPDPDCVICAYIDGAIIYSTCIAQEPQTCDTGLLASGEPCRVCYDGNGRTILDECGGACTNVVCPAIDCADGFQRVAWPGQCCGSCEPIDQCSGVVCAATDMAPPACPDGTRMALDPRDCCNWWCEPTECPPMAASDAAGVAMPAPVDCPLGYERLDEYPYCGRCVPVVDPTRYCQSAVECNQGEICTVDSECRVMDSCGCVESCDSGGTCTSSCTECACWGVCRPANWVCPDFAPPSPDACLDGRWESPGYDQYGCMLPPICVCFDGAIAVDGTCTDVCALVDCAPRELDCPAGEHPELGYPYCCGACVPDGECWTFADPCTTVRCETGTHCEPQRDCTAACVPDIASCFSSAECAPGTQCSTELGDCLPAPGCDSASGMMCPAVCTGVCVPMGCDFDADCPDGAHCEGSSVCPPDVTCMWQGEPGICVPDAQPTCTSSEQCGANEKCTTEDGTCRSAPSCDFDNTGGATCVDVCYGECVPTECAVTACGPALGMPSYLCADGRTVAGPTGRCLKDAAGACGWEVLTCP